MSSEEFCHVDIAETVNHISLCAGYGGIDLGLKRAIPSLRTIAFSEIEAFAVANLVAKMEAGLLDPAPVWTDVKTFPWEKFCGLVDILSGGYPCQPFSAAGKRLGKEDPRHLWPWIADGIRLCRPAVCFFENVEGHVTLGLSTVVSDLEEMGYQVSWGIFSASEVGAPHQRKRVFILAQLSDSKYMSGSTEQEFKYQERAEEHLRGNRLADSDYCGGGENSKPAKLRTNWSQQSPNNSRGIGQGEIEEKPPKRSERNIDLQQPERMAHCNSTRLQRLWQCIAEKGRKRTDGHTRSSCYSWPSRPSEQQHEWEPPRVVANANSNGDNGRELSNKSGEWPTNESAREQQRSGLQPEVGGCGECDKCLADPPSKRTNFGSELCSKKWGQEQILSREFDGPSSTSSETLDDTESYRNRQQSSKQQGGDSVVGSSEERAVCNATKLRRTGLRQNNTPNFDEQLIEPANTSLHTGLDDAKCVGRQKPRHISGSASKPSSRWQTQPPLGGDADGPAGGLDYAELQQSCDNRTDELRLLGNGVVPQTAEKAFLTLLSSIKCQGDGYVV